MEKIVGYHSGRFKLFYNTETRDVRVYKLQYGTVYAPFTGYVGYSGEEKLILYSELDDFMDSARASVNKFLKENGTTEWQNPYRIFHQGQSARKLRGL